MKQIIALTGLFGFVQLSNAQEDNAQIRGSVKAVEVREYSIAGGKTFSGLTEVNYSTDGKLLSLFEYVNDFEDPKPEFKSDSIKHGDPEIFEAVFIQSFDTKGRLNTAYRNERSTGKDRVVIHYRDSGGNDTLITSKTLDGKLLTQYRRKFDKNGWLVSWTETDFMNERTQSTGTARYETNVEGKIAKCHVDSVSWERAVEPFTRVYDSKGRMTEEYHLNVNKEKIYHIQIIYSGEYMSNMKVSRGSKGTVIYTYDDSGRLTSMEKLNNEGVRDFIRQSAYNEQGDEIENKFIQTKGNMTVTLQFKYEYDSNGNWVRKEEFENNMPYRIIERVITYY